MHLWMISRIRQIQMEMFERQSTQNCNEARIHRYYHVYIHISTCSKHSANIQNLATPMTL